MNESTIVFEIECIVLNLNAIPVYLSGLYVPVLVLPFFLENFKLDPKGSQQACLMQANDAVLPQTANCRSEEKNLFTCQSRIMTMSFPKWQHLQRLSLT